VAFRDQDREDALLEDIERRFGNRIREEFNASVEEMRERMTVEEIAQAIEQRGITSAQTILAIAAGSAASDALESQFSNVGAAWQEGFQEAGRQRADDLSGQVQGPLGTVRVSLDPGNEQMAARMREGRAKLVREITDQQRQVVENVVQDGLNRGINPRETARNVRQSIGLTAKQEQAVRNYREMLQGAHRRDFDAFDRNRQAGTLDDYLGYDLRDRRFDGSLRSAIQNDTPLSDSQVDRMTERYRQRMLRHRSEVIARTESLRAMSEGKDAALRQAVDEGQIREDQIRRKWRTARDSRVRENHRAIPGMNPDGVGLNEAFDAPLGPLRFPRDPQGSPAQTIQCRCVTLDEVADIDEVP